MAFLRLGTLGVGVRAYEGAGGGAFSAALTGDLRGQGVPAGVCPDRGWRLSGGEVAVAPVHEGEPDGLQVLAGPGQAVLEPRRPFGVLGPFQDARVGELRSRAVRMSRGAPVLATICSKRRSPKNTSRRASSDHFSPTTSSVRAMGHARGVGRCRRPGEGVPALEVGRSADSVCGGMHAGYKSVVKFYSLPHISLQFQLTPRGTR